jgi:hypothetical protein
MTVTIELPAEVEAGLQAQARAQGLALTESLKRLLRDQLPSLSDASISRESSPAEQNVYAFAKKNGNFLASTLLTPDHVANLHEGINTCGLLALQDHQVARGPGGCGRV